MNRVRIPRSDLESSKAIFGTSRLGGTVERYDKREALSILRATMDAGINAFDTADIYAQGNSERLLAEAFRKHRDQVIYATKGGYVLSSKARLLSKVKPLIRRFLKAKPGLVKATGRARGGQMKKDFSRAHLTRAVEASLTRLKTDRIDLYQLHSPDVADLVGSDAFEVLADLKSAGKIRAYGVSVLAWDDITHCIDHGVSWIQVTADWVDQGSHEEIHKQAAADRLLLVARQAFGLGPLGRAASTWTRDDFDGSESGLTSAVARMNGIASLGEPHEVILRYLHHHSPYGAFLTATTRMNHLQANLAALAMPAFTVEELAILKSSV